MTDKNCLKQFSLMKLAWIYCNEYTVMNSKRQVKAKIWSYDINWPLLFAVNGIFNLSIESKIIISRLDLSNVEQKSSRI